MGFGVLEQLIAKGQPSPIQTALGTMGKVQGLQLGALAPALRRAQTQLALAKAQQAQAAARTAGQGKIPDILTLYKNYQQSFTQNPHSAQTGVLAGALQKALQKSQGITQTTTPEGTTTLQIGGPAAAGQPTTTQITPGEALHPTHEAQANQQLINTQQQEQQQQEQQQQEQRQIQQIFPKQLTPAQLADEKQLGKDLATINAGANVSKAEGLQLFGQLRKAANDLGNKAGPVIGKFAALTPEGQRFNQLLGRAAKIIMSTVHNIRNQRELNLIMSGYGKTTMFSSVLKKGVNDILDEQYQNVLKQDFVKNYMAKGGKSSTEMNNLWSKMLTTGGIREVPDKYLDFNVSGSNRSYKDYVKTMQNLVKKNPNNKQLNNLPIVSLIKEDIEGGQ